MGQNYEVTNAGLVKFRQKGTEQLVLEQGTVLPVDGITGQIFWKTDTASFKVHNGAAFQSVGAWIDSGTVLTLPAPGRQVQLSDGSAAAPAITFQTQTNKGLFNPGSNLLGVAVGGVKVAVFNNNADLTLSAGGSYYLTPAVSGVTPRLASTNGELAIITQNVTQLTIGYSGNVTLANGQVLAPNGSVGAPTYSYGTETTTGHFRDATYLNMVNSGVTLLRVGTSHVEVVNGSAANPAYSYINSQNAGAFLVSANIIAWSTSSTEALRIDASQNLLSSGSSISVVKSNSGGNQVVSIQNTSNTASSGAISQVTVAGTSGGDAFTQYAVTGATTWAAGIDNSDGDKYKISASSYPGTNDYLVIDPVSGVVTMPNTTFVATSVLAGNGTVGAPSIAFSAHTNYGIYWASNYVRIAANGSDAFIFSAGTSQCYGDLIPSADNTYRCGISGTRWSELRAVNVYTGDLHLDNGWTITEGDKVGRDKDEVILLSPAGKKFKFLVTEVA